MNCIHALWAAPMCIGLSIYFLWQVIGIPSLSGLLVLTLLIPINAYFAAKLKYFNGQLMQIRDQRVKLISEIVKGIKVGL